LRVGVHAWGAVTAAGMGVPRLLQALADPSFAPRLELPRPDAPPLPVAVCADFDPKGVLPPLVARRLDRASRLLAVAAKEALQQAGSLPWPKEQVGVAMGTWNAGTSPLLEILQAVFTQGPEQAPPMHFPNSVANAPASQVGILETLGGANLTFFEKQAGGLRAIAEAWRLVARGRVAAMLAGGVDEAQWLNAEAFHRLGALARPGRPGFTLGEGAVALLLAPGGAVTLAGAGAASLPCPPHLYPPRPDALLLACQKALREAGLAPQEVELWVSLANGHPQLASLELQLLEALFPRHRPQVLAPLTTRLGEGAFASALRVGVAAAVLASQVLPAWPLPPHLETAGYEPARGAVRTALLAAQAGGGSAVALVLVRQQTA